MSVLGFGCAALMGRASRKESEQAVGAALDAGITFFDTARSYGYGQSESVLGSVLKTCRERMVICTKFGILPGAGDGWKHRIKPLARVAVKAFPGLRKIAQRQAASEIVGGQFSVEVLKQSVEMSLRELGTDYLDMLLMHAAPASALAQDDLMDELRRMVESGMVRMAGISAELPVISKYFEARPKVLRTAQFAMDASRMDFANETKQNADLLLVANHPFGGPGGSALARLIALAGDVRLAKELREKLDVRDPQVLPEVILNCILDGTGVSAVVPAMMQVKHIASNVKAVEECRFSGEELEILRGVLGG